MATRVCYVHIGPYKTGTSSIQWFLKENRAELLRHGCFVPESRTWHGAHHPLAHKLCGRELPDHKQSAEIDFIRQLNQSASQSVVISSERLDELLRNADYARTFFGRIRELELEPQLIFFPRNQPQSINSRYAEGVRDFGVSEPFESFVQEIAQSGRLKYMPLVELANTHNVAIIARPFTAKTASDIVPVFLQTIGVDSAQFCDTKVHRNQTIGPFTVSVARHVSVSLLGRAGQFNDRQARRCKITLAAYLEKNGLEDFGYCGLSTALARQIEQTCLSDNDAFAQCVWQRSWNNVFGSDTRQEFVPNDFDIRRPDFFTRRRLRRAIREMEAAAQEILNNPTLILEPS